MGLNIIRETLPSLPFAAQEDFVDLTPGVLTKAIHLEVEATVDIAGGAASGTVFAESIQRLLTSIRVVRDGEEIMDLPGRLVAALWRRSVAQGPNFTELAAAGVQTTAIRAKFGIPFARGWLADPFDTVDPALSARQEYRLFATWSQDVNAGAGSAAGSGALVTGGDRAITFTVGPTLRIVQEYAEVGSAPIWAPRYESFEVDRFTAADTRLQAAIRRGAIIDGILIAARDSATALPTDILVNDITFRGASRRYVDEMRWDQLQDMDQELHPGVTALHRAGYAFIQLADGGKLGNAVNLDAIVNPMLEFDVAAPAAGNGQITVVLSTLESIPGVTRR